MTRRQPGAGANGGRSTRPLPVLALVAAIALTGPARAEEAPETSEEGIAAQAFQAAHPMPPGGMADWPAIGRLGGSLAPDAGGCTATLVGPDLILTAGHCLPRAPGPMAAARAVFAAGFDDGAFAAQRRGRYTIRSTVFDDPVTGIGLLRLDRPIPPDQAVPIPLAAPSPEAVPYTIIGYRNTAPARPVLLAPCAGMPAGGRYLLVDCPVVSGNSGAPVLVQTPQGPRLVAVVTAHTQNTGPRRGIATLVSDDFARIIAEGPARDGGRQPLSATAPAP